MGQRSIREYEFDGFRVEVASRRLRKADSTPVELSARGFDVLLYLLQHPGEDVSKERLLERPGQTWWSKRTTSTRRLPRCDAHWAIAGMNRATS